MHGNLDEIDAACVLFRRHGITSTHIAVDKPRSWAMDGTVEIRAPIVQAVGFKLEGSGATTQPGVESLQACVHLCKHTPCAGVWLQDITCTTYESLGAVEDVGVGNSAVAIVSQGMALHATLDTLHCCTQRPTATYGTRCWLSTTSHMRATS